MVKNDETGQSLQKPEQEHEEPPKVRPWIISGALLSFVAFSFIAYLHPNLPDRIKFATESILSSYVLLTVITQAFIYDQQRKAMTQQLKAMRSQTRQMYKQVDAMVYGQRAYLTLSSFERRQGYADTQFGSARFHLQIENSGNTPANRVRLFEIGTVRPCLPIPEVAPSQWVQLGVIAPQGHATHTIDLTHNLELLRGPDRKESYHCQGIIRYEDIFGNAHHTLFCLELDEGPIYRGIPCREGGNEAH